MIGGIKSRMIIEFINLIRAQFQSVRISEFWLCGMFSFSTCIYDHDRPVG
jgi:hypothetical protein